MKKLVSLYRVFYPRIYFPLMFILAPAVVIVFEVLVGQELSFITASIVGMMALMVGVMADYFIFNAICSKDYNFGVLKHSLDGRKTLQQAILFDQIRRLFMIIVFTASSSLVYVFGPEEYEMEILWKYISFGIGLYIADTILLMILRNLKELYFYYLSAIFGVTILGSIVVAAFVLSIAFEIYFWFVPIILAVIAVALTIVNQFVMIRGFDKSFRKGMVEKDV